MRNIVSTRFVASRPAMLLVLPAVSCLLAAAGLFASPAAHAETRIFYVENQPDGYGIDQCLASGQKCGRPMARAYCQSHEYGEAVSFRKAEPDEMPKETSDSACSGSGCVNFVAIECQR